MGWLVRAEESAPNKIVPAAEQTPAAPFSLEPVVVAQAANDNAPKIDSVFKTSAPAQAVNQQALKGFSISDLAASINKPAVADNDNKAIDIVLEDPVKIETSAPAVTAPVIEIAQPKTEVATEVPEAPKTEHLRGREILEKFLEEIAEFYDLNKRLAEEKSKQATLQNVGKEKQAERDTLNADAIGIQEAIKSLMLATEGTKSSKDLEPVISAFQKYQSTLHEEISEEERKGNKEINTVLATMNAINSRLKKIIELCGGQAAQQKILDTVNALNRMGERYAQRIGGDLGKAREYIVSKGFEDLMRSKHQVEANDSGIVKHLAGTPGKIVDLMMMFVQNLDQSKK